MRKWLPSKKTVGIWVGAALIAVLAVPATPFSPQTNFQHRDGGAPAQSYPHSRAIPTLSEAPALDDTVQLSEGPSRSADSSAVRDAQPLVNSNTTSEKSKGTPKPKGTPGNGTTPSGKAPTTPRAVTPPGAAKPPGAVTPPGAAKPPGAVTPPEAAKPPGATTPPGATLPVPDTSVPPNPFANLPTAKLRIKVIDGRTLQPLPGAEVVVIETEQRIVTDKDGYTPYIDAPIIRNPRYRPMIAELHGQLGVVVYKNGYRDSIHLGIRVHEDGSKTESTVWMYKLGPGDTRVEPVLYQVPYHHLWLVELADKFRSKTQPGEGPERP